MVERRGGWRVCVGMVKNGGAYKAVEEEDEQASHR
jgi:hypothetical protein